MASRELSRSTSGASLGSGALDTSGEVWLEPQPLGDIIRWSDLSPFEQGYIEALFAEADFDPPMLGEDAEQGWGFSDLSPEALGVIRKDCAGECAEFGHKPGDRRCMASEDDGAALFHKIGRVPFLSEGKVCLREDS